MWLATIAFTFCDLAEYSHKKSRDLIKIKISHWRHHLFFLATTQSYISEFQSFKFRRIQVLSATRFTEA